MNETVDAVVGNYVVDEGEVNVVDYDEKVECLKNRLIKNIKC